MDRLVFGGLDWVYAGTKRLTKDIDVDKVAAETDFILLTQVGRSCCWRQ